MSTARIIDLAYTLVAGAPALGRLNLDACGEAVLSSPSMTQSGRLGSRFGNGCELCSPVEFDRRDGSVDLRRRAIPRRLPRASRRITVSLRRLAVEVLFPGSL